jgi:hypothetical protein
MELRVRLQMRLTRVLLNVLDFLRGRVLLLMKSNKYFRQPRWPNFVLHMLLREALL